MCPDSPVGKPRCKCGHLYEFHQPDCMECKCYPYVPETEVTITDKMEKEDKVAQPKLRSHSVDIKTAEPQKTVSFWCPRCGTLEKVSVYMLPGWHRHGDRLFRLLEAPK